MPGCLPIVSWLSSLIGGLLCCVLHINQSKNFQPHKDLRTTYGWLWETALGLYGPQWDVGSGVTFWMRNKKNNLCQKINLTLPQVSNS
jgi:hypothetical protein